LLWRLPVPWTELNDQKDRYTEDRDDGRDGQRPADFFLAYLHFRTPASPEQSSGTGQVPTTARGRRPHYLCGHMLVPPR
jgi:hypothetical protein